MNNSLALLLCAELGKEGLSRSNSFVAWLRFAGWLIALLILIISETRAESQPAKGDAADSQSAEHVARFRKLDLNEDGYLSGKEARSYLRYDTDGDGRITLEEFLAGARRTARDERKAAAETEFKALDVNEDGRLTGSEMRSVRQFDTDGDGRVSKADLSTASVHDASLKGTNLRNVRGMSEIYNANFAGADLRGADLAKALDINNSARFRKAKYDRRTVWPRGFDVESSGAVLVEEEEKPATPEKPARPSADDESAKSLEKEFAKLDVNDDQVLSGKEMKGLKSYDTNKDGEITLAEFIAGRTKARKAKKADD